MRRAAARGHNVLFVETGDFLGRHVARLLRGPGRASLARRILTGEPVAPLITVRKALNILPWGQRFSICSRINGRVSRLVVRRAARSLPGPCVTWLYDPRSTWAIGRVGDEFGVYDCVDDYAEQASGHRNRALVAAADRRAAAEARLVFTTTTSLHRRHSSTNSKTFLIGNAADFAHFAAAVDRSIAPEHLANLARPVLGFAGNITSRKVDLALLRALADNDGARTVLLAGPAEPSLEQELEVLARRPNVTWTGPVPYDELPAVVSVFDIGLIPYADNAYTRNVFPLKLFEYLAAGKPVVATGLPELAGLGSDVRLARDLEEVEEAVAQALEQGSRSDVERRQALAARNTWEARAERLLSLVDAELSATDDERHFA
jgi:glycosyltransferase involved in cell wall biosynthesis